MSRPVKKGETFTLSWHNNSPYPECVEYDSWQMVADMDFDMAEAVSCVYERSSDENISGFFKKLRDQLIASGYASIEVPGPRQFFSMMETETDESVNTIEGFVERLLDKGRT